MVLKTEAYLRVMRCYFALITMVLLCPVVLQAQVPVQPQRPGATADTMPPGGGIRTVYIVNADRLSMQKVDSVTTLQTAAGNVHFRQDNTDFYADSIVLNQFTSIVQSYGRVHINDSDSLNTYAKYLRYDGKTKIATLEKDVKLVDSKGGVLTTQELVYDLNASMATYNNNGKIVNKKTTLTSKRGTYYGGTKDVVFGGNVLLQDPEYKIAADSLQYNTQNEVATFIAPTTIVTGKRTIFTRKGYYNLQTGKAEFFERPSIVDSTYSIDAEEMAFDDKEGLAQFRGNVVYVDTANGISVLSNQLYANKKESSFLATQNPLLILKQETDSLFVTADTLYSGKISVLSKTRSIPFIRDTANGNWIPPDLAGKDSSADRFFEAWHHVRIFSDSVQAVADSLFYAGSDSAFRLFSDPIVWASESQITADTIYLFTKDKKAERLWAYYNSFIINKIGGNQYNQVKGNTLNALFKEGTIDYVRAKGRAETVYYALDEQDQYVGMNRATSDAVDLFFEERKAKKVLFIKDLQGTLYPITQIPLNEDRLNGFNWLEGKRPKSYLELMEN